MMRKAFFLAFCLFFYACLESESTRISISLAEKRGEMDFRNIVSMNDKRDEEAVRRDFQDLLDILKPENSDDPEGIRTVEQALYQEGNHLNGVSRFVFEDPAKVLEEFQISIDENGDYVMDLSANHRSRYAGSNGQYVEEGERKIIRWGKDAQEIVVVLRSTAFVQEKAVSMLPYWLAWKSQEKEKPR